MNCLTCKVNKIGPVMEPFGGYFCSNEHLQCNECNISMKGHCGVCKASTKFLQMKLNSPKSSSEPRSTVPLTSIFSKKQPSFSQQLFEEIETQSRLSKEHLSMKDSRELDIKKETDDTIAIEGNLNKYKNCERTLVMTDTNTHNCLSGIGFNDHQETAKVENVNELSKFERKGHCGVCEGSTTFIQMDLNSPMSSSEPLSTPPQTSIFSKEQPRFSQQLFEEIETQSKLFNENLGMKDSKELDIKKEADDTIAIEGNLNTTKNCVKTLFMSSTNTHNFVSGIGFKDHQETAKVENVNELSKFESEKTPTFFTEEHNDTRKGNAFSFKQNVNNLSEIRFLDSSDSLENLYRNSKMDVSNNKGKQENSLSVEVLRDYEIKNSSNSKEVVNKYLQSYSPNVVHPRSGYSCQQYHCNVEHQPRKPKAEIAVRTVSVSTESDPSLKSTCVDEQRENFSAKLKPHDYFIMPAVGATSALQHDSMLLDKMNKSSVDMRMQKVLETLKEDSKATKLFDQPHLIKIQTLISTKEPDIREHFENRPLKSEDKNAVIFTQLINTYRAFYNPPNPLIVPVNTLYTRLQTQPAQQEPPLPQFQTVPCSSSIAQELFLKRSKFLNIKPVTACMLNIPRSPIHCPESACQRMIFISDFNKHLVVDHNHLPMERITPFQCKNFFIEARLAHCGTSKCHLLYLMRDKIKDLGSSEYKDFLPILIMTSRISLNQICGLRNHTSDLEYFLIWVTGIASEEFPISVSLTIWSRSGRAPSCHIVYSGQMYSIRNSQSALDVWRSGRMLLLSSQEINALTSNGKEMLNLQLSVH